VTRRVGSDVLLRLHGRATRARDLGGKRQFALLGPERQPQVQVGADLLADLLADLRDLRGELADARAGR
jgi:hypothetical protein